MQCPSCQFENMPGTVECGRCGARMNLAAAAINVHPPRAGRWEKRFGNVYHFLRPFQWVRDVIDEARRHLVIQAPAGALVRAVCPGWPQFYLGRRQLGRALLGGYLVMLALGCLFAGTSLGAICLGLAIAAHVSTIIDVVFHGTREFDSRILYSLATCAIVGGLLYLPAGWALSQVASPQQLLADAPPFREGDVVLCSSLATPLAGDVVLYDVTPNRFTTYPHNYYQIEGRRIDRILAGPGQTAEWKQGELWVDGQRSPWLPLNPGILPPNIKVQVPAGYYLIFPTTDPTTRARLSASDWALVGQVPTDAVVGRVYLRLQPLWRLGRIR